MWNEQTDNHTTSRLRSTCATYRQHIAVDQTGKPNLVIDEAHNLPARAMDYYSPALSSVTLENMRDEIRKANPRFRYEAEELLGGCLQVVSASQKGETAKPQRIAPPMKLFSDQHARLGAFLSRYLDSGVEILNQDVILRLCYYWAEFIKPWSSSEIPISRSSLLPFIPIQLAVR